jgi:hypothetical protein
MKALPEHSRIKVKRLRFFDFDLGNGRVQRVYKHIPLHAEGRRWNLEGQRGLLANPSVPNRS